MGCDIHELIEVYDDLYGNWEMFSNYSLIPRSYSLFTVLADVRNMNKERKQNDIPICEPRGFPEDCSKEAKELSEYWNIDGHSRSYHTFKQLKEHKNPEEFYKDWVFYKVMEVLAKEYGEENVRLLFLFDN